MKSREDYGRQGKRGVEDVKAIVEGLSDSLADTSNFHHQTMERVFSILNNEEEYHLHPLVKRHLEAIKELGGD